jgi:heme O synthase-like polyprenyltransferase
MGLRKSVTLKWARGVFGASLLYLVVLFAAIAVDAIAS